MTTITHRLSAKCPPAALWDILSDLTAVQTYNPMVRSARIEGTQRQGTGAMRRCELLPNGEILERVTTWEVGRSLGLEIVESDWPVRSMSWVTTVEPVGAGCDLVQRLDYQMKYGPAGWVLNALVMRRAIETNVGRALSGLIARAEART